MRQNTPISRGTIDSHIEDTCGEGWAIDWYKISYTFSSNRSCLTIIPDIKKLTPATEPSTSSFLVFNIRLVLLATFDFIIIMATYEITMTNGGQEAMIIATTWPSLGLSSSYNRIGNPMLQRIAMIIFVIGRPWTN